MLNLRVEILVDMKSNYVSKTLTNTSSIKHCQPLNASYLIVHPILLMYIVHTSIKLSAFHLILWMNFPSFMVLWWYSDTISLFCFCMYDMYEKLASHSRRRGNEIIRVIHYEVPTRHCTLSFINKKKRVIFIFMTFSWCLDLLERLLCFNSQTMFKSDVDQVITEDWPWIASFFVFILILLLISNKCCCACCHHDESKDGINPSVTINIDPGGYNLFSGSSRRNSRIYHHV